MQENHCQHGQCSRPIRCVLVDISGTLHVGDTPIKGAVESIRKLISLETRGEIRVLFLTNTTTVACSTLLERLLSMGFPENMNIMTTAHAVTQYIKENGLNPFYMVEPDMKKDLDGACDAVEEQGESHDSVLVGLSPSHFQYDELNRAFRILQSVPSTSGPRRLLAFHRSNFLRDADKKLSLGPGGFIACLEHTTGHQAHIFGKPSIEFFTAALRKLDMDLNESDCREQCIMVGDDYVNDILGAQEAGIRHAILLKTGKYQTNDETHIQDAIVLPSIVEAVDFIVDTLSSTT